MGILGSVVAWFASPAHWTGPNGVPIRLVEHVEISAAAMAVAILIALPAGVALGHLHRFGNLAINVSNVGRAIPSFAILVIAFQVFGLGNIPAFAALTLLAIPPMLTNSYIAVRDADPAVLEAARAMRMPGRRERAAGGCSSRLGRVWGMTGPGWARCGGLGLDPACGGEAGSKTQPTSTVTDSRHVRY